MTIQLVQQIHKLPEGRLPSLALKVSRNMKIGWWSQLVKWLKEYELEEDKILDYKPTEIRRRAVHIQ